jgi:hypothetical protein
VLACRALQDDPRKILEKPFIDFLDEGNTAIGK